MLKTYQAVALNTSSWVIRNGRRIYGDVADCGHNHKTIEEASDCLGKLRGRAMRRWRDAEIRDASVHPASSWTGVQADTACTR